MFVKVQNIFIQISKHICSNCKLYLSKFKLEPRSNHERPTPRCKGEKPSDVELFWFYRERETDFTAIALHRILNNCTEYLIENTEEYKAILEILEITATLPKEIHPMHIRYKPALKWNL